jgi:hypothetical protein
MTPDAIFASSANIAPDVANTFVQLLTAQTRRLPSTPGMQGGTTDVGSIPVDAPDPAESSTEEVRTFGMPDPEE